MKWRRKGQADSVKILRHMDAARLNSENRPEF
jgi:hypothetical protein